ncbi:methyltransferase [Micromonospora carbonacea]|uniref:Hydroxyneurosporene-O-methyltransferase n=1 Tax=Micromonospora carbonacea TaxID=47853 RepID=A0A1C4VEX7_9ACTN|nr:methyltransferase [Micromonospora carbonacea]SCE82391.1 hydroxyneurosporene-O-methyltransferase [Micromonospora carbonacea]
MTQVSAVPSAAPSSEPPPQMQDRAVIMRLMFGAWLQQALYVAAKLDVADALADGPRDIEALAGEVGADPTALARFLRALVSAGVFAEPSPGRFELNGPAEYLRSSVPNTHKYIAILHGEEAYAACAEVLHTAHTGRPAFDVVYGKPYFSYIAGDPKARATFDAAMGRETAVPLVVAQCDFGAEGTVVDVGGGVGALLAAVLVDRPGLTGVLFDLPESSDAAREHLAGLGLAARVRVVGGTAFDSVPAGGDVYTISRVLHDFDDEQVLTILGNVRSAMSPSARLMVFDALLTERPGFNPGRMADLGMLMVLGGRYRTEAEMRDLLSRAGFRVTEVRHARDADPRAESVLEAVPA